MAEPTVDVQTPILQLKKKPKKSILKSSTSFDQPDGGPPHAAATSAPPPAGAAAGAAAAAGGHAPHEPVKFDEMNILATYHPADKDYGHMKIDEPKTPYNYTDPEQDPSNNPVDAAALADKIIMTDEAPPSPRTRKLSISEDDDAEPSAENMERRKSFEEKRKKHYNEFQAVRLARKLMEEELAELDDDDEGGGSAPPAPVEPCPGEGDTTSNQ